MLHTVTDIFMDITFATYRVAGIIIFSFSLQEFELNIISTINSYTHIVYFNS